MGIPEKSGKNNQTQEFKNVNSFKQFPLTRKYNCALMIPLRKWFLQNSFHNAKSPMHSEARETSVQRNIRIS
jgi:hypothetical protein